MSPCAHTHPGDSEEGEDDDGLLTIILQTFTKKRQEAKARKAAILEDAKNKVTQVRGRAVNTLVHLPVDLHASGFPWCARVHTCMCMS